MDKKVLVALRELERALAEASCCNDIDTLNAYSIMEQEVGAAASHCAQTLYWNEKLKGGKSNDKNT